MTLVSLKQIALDFETDLLDGVRSGVDETGLTKIRDEAFERLRAVKEGPSAPPLETIFDAAFEMGAKLNMALETIK
ncbi:hypothetical protein ABIG06_006844 [Bradyrhizobium sp. USDA 326]|uniref:hypothetical protein n=1 Tax=Bradyrhizobium sp. USDA 326 TaxID=3377726 RepID=UPI003C77F844